MRRFTDESRYIRGTSDDLLTKADIFIRPDDLPTKVDIFVGHQTIDRRGSTSPRHTKRSLAPDHVVECQVAVACAWRHSRQETIDGEIDPDFGGHDAISGEIGVSRHRTLSHTQRRRRKMSCLGVVGVKMLDIKDDRPRCRVRLLPRRPGSKGMEDMGSRNAMTFETIRTSQRRRVSASDERCRDDTRPRSRRAGYERWKPISGGGCRTSVFWSFTFTFTSQWNKYLQTVLAARGEQQASHRGGENCKITRPTPPCPPPRRQRVRRSP